MQYSKESKSAKLIMPLINEAFGKYVTLATIDYKIGTEPHFLNVNMLLFHRLLQGFIAISIRDTCFKPGYSHEMEELLPYIHLKERLPHEQTGVGITFHKHYNELIVNYTYRNPAMPKNVLFYANKQTRPEHLAEYLPEEPKVQAWFNRIKKVI